MAAAGLFVVKALMVTAAVGAVSSMMQPDEPPPPPPPPDVHRNQEGRRLSDLKVQYSSYGKVIPLIYGTMRLAGNVIWSRPIAESQINTTDVRAGNSHASTVYTHHTNYAYTATLAIALCKGSISGLLRVWADSKQVDLSQFNHTLYHGDEVQLPDTTILSFEGQAPAYRGLAYIVIRDFPLAEYGNRIPTFTFEIRRNFSNGLTLENKIKEITFGLGVGEHLYDTVVQEKVDLVAGQQSGTAVKINQNNSSNKADALVALDNMQQVVPGASWVSLPVYWILNTEDATIKPAVNSVNQNSRPDEWRVAGYTRSTAHHASNGFSTPSDVSILRTAQELKRRGYKVMLCPRLLQRRGDTFVRSYVTSVQGKQYTNFITHYANLLADHIDAFVIASCKLLGFDGVAYCKDLASAVKATFKTRNIKVVLSAFSKHYHARQGIYYMDGIWSDSNIDVIGIEGYFPLGRSSTYEQVRKAWRKGEGWHHEGTRFLSKAFAWKNIQYWWENFHADPDDTHTSWQPRMKPIWITELAFGSVDGCARDPEAFSELHVAPKEPVDFAAQRIALEASLDYLKSQECIEKVFVRFWDTRPHPFYPLLKDKWQLPYTWEKDCSLQGKLGLMTLGSIVSDLLQQAGFLPSMYDVSDLQEVVQGFSISNRQSIRRSLEQLAAAYFFDCLEADGILSFVKRGSGSKATIDARDCIDQEGSFVITRLQELELPKAVNVSYSNLSQNYETGTVKAERQTVNALNHVDINLPIVLSQVDAQRIAEVALLQSWITRTQYKLILLPKHTHLRPTDVITVRKFVEHSGKGKRTVGSKQKHLMRIVSTKLAANGVQEIVAVAENVSSYKYHAETIETVSQVSLPPSRPKTEIFLFSIPDATDKAVLSCAAFARTEGWRGCNLYANDEHLGQILTQATVGTALSFSTKTSTPYTWDRHTTIDVVLIHGELSSTTEANVLAGANSCLIGNELLQFQYATFVDKNRYRLHKLLRGRRGTEAEINTHGSNERFIFLDSNIHTFPIPALLWGTVRNYKAVSFGEHLHDAKPVGFHYHARALMPYAPCHFRVIKSPSGDMTFKWKRRARINGDWLNNIDAPLSESSEQYEVEIMQDQKVKRAIKCTKPTATYTAQDHIADFGTIQSPLRARIYQLSEIAGRGTAANVILTWK